jgi:DNA-binding transcriptional LysR family regulator
VTNLERELGVTLIDRGSRPVALTASGEIVLRHAEDLLGRAAAIEQELAALTAGDAGTLRLGGFFTAWTSVLPRAVAAYSLAHPGVQLELRQLEPEPAIRALRAGDIDLAVVYRYAPVEDELDRLALFDDPFVVAVPSGHRLARRRSIPLAELARERWVSPPPDTPHTRILLRLCREQGFEPEIAFETVDVATAQPLVAARLAVAVLPMLAAAPTLEGVVVRPLEGKPPARTVELVQPPARLVPSARAMVDAIRAANP